MAPPSRDDRLSAIIAMLKRENGMPVQQIADRLAVSHMTVRRDLDILAESGQVRLIHGGALLNPAVYSVGGESNYSLIAAGTVNSSRKQSVGAASAALIEAGETLIIDSGSTTEWIARYLPEDVELTVLSYALNIVTETAGRPNCRSVFAGGTLHENLLMFESPEGLQMVRRFRANKAFISAAGVSEQFGVTCANAYERDTKRAAMKSAASRILVVDSTKFGVLRSEHFAELSEFDTVVTDEDVDRKTVAALKRLGIALVRAPLNQRGS